MGIESTKKLAVELIDWFKARNVDPDDLVPALLIVGVKLAVNYGAANDDLLHHLQEIVRASFVDEQEKKDKRRN